jgi:hypothetical protein
MAVAVPYALGARLCGNARPLWVKNEPGHADPDVGFTEAEITRRSYGSHA